MIKTLEKTLTKIVEEYRTTEKEISVDGKQYIKQDVDELIKTGYLKKMDCSTCSGWEYLVTPTEKALHYKEYKQQSIKPKVIDWLKYGITTLIAIGALIVAIISLCRK